MKLSERVTSLTESATLAVSVRAGRMRAEGVDIVSFGAGEPDFDTPEPIKRAAVEALRAGHTGYPKPTSGIPAAKQAVCTKLARDNNLTYVPGQVIVTAGGKMAIYLAIQALVEPGDEVILGAPYWVSFPEIVKLAGGKPVVVRGDEPRDYRLAPDQLAAAITPRTRAVILNSPSNPSGVTYSPKEVRALAEVLVERDLVVLSDETYEQLCFTQEGTLSYGAVSDRAYAQALTINTASKSYAMTGWRIAYAAGPVELIAAMAKLQTQTTSGAATFTQHALIEALTGDQTQVGVMRAEFRRRGELMHAKLCAISGVRCPKPTGAFYCFPNVSAAYARLGVDGSKAFCERLLEEAHVAAVPGIAFGLDEHIRVSFATSPDQIEKGIDRIARFLG